jgi:diguanylate cyclase (GGDEF)-like protein/PAS domain S-box-containing protein
MYYLIAFLIVIFSEVAVCANEFKGLSPVQAHSAERVLQLTQGEKKWLSRHKNIRVAYDASLPPYSFVNDQGKVDGYAVEIIALLSQRLGIDFSIQSDANWHNLYKAAVKRKVDMVATMVDRPDRAKSFVFTKPYLTKSLVIVTKQENNSISNRNDLADKRIAVVKGYQYGEQVGHEFPKSKRVIADSMLDSLVQVDKGKVDAAILFLGTANYLQAKHRLTKLKVAAFYDRNSANESIAVRKDWSKLVGILQKGLDSLTEEEVQKIFAKWVVQGGVVGANQKAVKKVQPVILPAIKNTVEIGQESASLNISKPTVETTRRFNAVGKLIGALLILLSLVALGFYLIRRQRNSGQTSSNDVVVSDGNLQAADHDAEQLTKAPELDSSASELKPDAQADLQGEQAIILNIEQLRAMHEAQSISPADESIRYQRDAEGRFIYVSPSVTSLLGYSDADFMENYRHYLTGNPVNQGLDAYVEACIQGQPNEVYEIEIYDAGRGIHWLEVCDSPVYDGLGHCIGIEGVMSDITAQKLYDKLSAKISEPDLAVEAYRQQSLHDHLQLAITTANGKEQTFALIFLSLERLRFLDGSLIGYSDIEVLKEANKRLRATLRDTDSVVSLEGDKFALILPDTDNQKALLIAEKIRKILQVPYLVGIQSMVLDAKLGIAIYPEHGFDPDALISQTQNLLPTHSSDSLGLNIPIDPNAQDEDSLRLQQDLVMALDECKVALRALNPHNINALHRHSQFSIYYQSQHNLEDYAITGFEALIRWQHPELGQLLPNDFVDLVKDIGLLDVMTYWIVQQVCFQAMVWEKGGVRPKLMAINLGNLASNQTIELAKIVNIIEETGARPEWFAFSIPEREIAKEQDLVVPIIKQLAAEGFTVSIDNFGADSTLLAQLKLLPAQIIELDPAFIRHLPENNDDAELVAYSIAMLHGWGKTVIAKEIESERQLEFLKTIGCDIIQGHLLSRPLPAKEAKKLMETLPEFAWYLKQ